METTLKINPEITITLPEDKIIVDRSGYEQLKRDADYRGLWDVTELKNRYHRDKEWFKRNVFSPYERELRDHIVMYPHGGKSSYLCKPIPFDDFVQIHFPEISKRAEK